MAKILGLGGIFIKSLDPKRLCSWYQEHLGLELETAFDGAVFKAANQNKEAYAIWSAFDEKTTYLQPSNKDYMINFVVDDVEQALTQVKAAGAEVVDEPQAMEYGTFGWFVDPDGNKVELWKPPS